MDFKKLGEIADILISNVDKKTKENEYPVKLCNFVDVYYNWAISSYHYQNLMNATATKQEIDICHSVWNIIRPPMKFR